MTTKEARPCGRTPSLRERRLELCERLRRRLGLGVAVAVRDWGMALDDAPADDVAAGFFDDLLDLPVPADELDELF